MHYYQFNIGDYRKDTTHLTALEHYIYRTLLDQYYLNEEPLKDDLGYILRILRLSNDRSTTVEQVLNEFFTKVEQGWIQLRAKGEIEGYNRRRKSASEAGKKSAKARKHAACEPAFNDRSTTVQLTNNHKPITNNHSFRKPTVSEIQE